MARRMVTLFAFALGLAMLAFGIAGFVSTTDAPAPDLPGGAAFAVRDSSIVAMMGGGLLMLGALRLATKRPADE